MPALVPPEITMDPKWQEKIENDMKVIPYFHSFIKVSHWMGPLASLFWVVWGVGARYHHGFQVAGEDRERHDGSSLISIDRYSQYISLSLTQLAYFHALTEYLSRRHRTLPCRRMMRTYRNRPQDVRATQLIHINCTRVIRPTISLKMFCSYRRNLNANFL